MATIGGHGAVLGKYSCFLKLRHVIGNKSKKSGIYRIPAACIIMFVLIYTGFGSRRSTRTQRGAQAIQNKFCKDLHLASGSATIPDAVELSWSKLKAGEMELRQFTSGVPKGLQVSADNALLIRTLIRSDVNQMSDNEYYTIYAFDSSQGPRDIVSDSLVQTGSWERSEAAAHVMHLTDMAKELDVPRSEIYFVDIGANLGAFTMYVAAAGFSVIAIEAMKVNQQALRLTLCANSEIMRRVTLFPAALGQEPAQCTLYSAEHNVLDGTIRCGASSGVATHNMTSIGGVGMLQRETVQIQRLDDMLSEWMPALKGKVGALKIDTEGFEPWVFNGGKRFFTEVKPRFVQLEISDMTKEATGIDAPDFLQSLVDMGYNLRKNAFDTKNVRPQDVPRYSGVTPANVYLFSNG